MSALPAFRFIGTFLVLLATAPLVHGASVTKGGLLNMNMAVYLSVDAYAKANGGNLPTSWEDLDGHFALERIERSRDRKACTDIHLYGSTRPKYKGELDEDVEIVAMTAFVIYGDRRFGKGRYAVVRQSTGRIEEAWLKESVIQAAAKAAKVPAPSAGTVGYPYNDVVAGALIAFLAIGIWAYRGRMWRWLLEAAGFGAESPGQTGTNRRDKSQF